MAETFNSEELERFQQLVEQAEQASRDDPSNYRRRVTVLAVLGHAVLVGTAAALVAVLGLYVWSVYSETALLDVLFSKAAIFPIAILVFVLARALWARVEPPQGYRVSRGAAPALYKEIDALTTKLATPRIHEVRISTDLNAAIVQTPRLGALGWNYNTLVLGIQLLMALTPSQARAVLAHELGHLSSNHGGSNRWLYKARDNWRRVMDAYAGDQSWGGGWMRQFFEWYAPYFGAYSFVLARSFEYEADAVAAEITSKETTAMALVSCELKGSVVEEQFWKPLWALADQESGPVADAYSRLAVFLRDYRPQRAELLARISSATETDTGLTDSHPALRDRLAALGAPPEIPKPMRRTAAEVWLERRYHRLLEKMDEAWAEQEQVEWQERYIEVQAARERLDRLAEMEIDALLPEALWERAQLTERFSAELQEDPLSLYYAYYRRCPSDPQGELALGRLLLARDDPRGVIFIRHAAEHEGLVLEASRLAMEYFERVGNELERRNWARRAQQQQEIEQAAERERASVRVTDAFEPAQLSGEQVREVRARLRNMDEVDRLYLARKRLNHHPERPLFVVAYESKLRTPKLEQRLVALLDLPGQSYVIKMGGKQDRVAEKVKRAGERLR